MYNSTVFINSNVWNVPWRSGRIVALNSMSVSTEHAKEEMNLGKMLYKGFVRKLFQQMFG